jgi:hypothetical protein
MQQNVNQEDKFVEQFCEISRKYDQIISKTFAFILSKFVRREIATKAYFVTNLMSA